MGVNGLIGYYVKFLFGNFTQTKNRKQMQVGPKGLVFFSVVLWFMVGNVLVCMLFFI